MQSPDITHHIQHNGKLLLIERAFCDFLVVHIWYGTEKTIGPNFPALNLQIKQRPLRLCLKNYLLKYPTYRQLPSTRSWLNKLKIEVIEGIIIVPAWRGQD